MKKRRYLPGFQRGMMMIEGLITILIFSLGILSIIGLQASTARYTADSKYRLDAAFLANQAIGTMWTDRGNLYAYQVSNETVSGLPNGKRTVLVQGNVVTVTITWKMPGETKGHSYSAIAQING